VLHRLHDLEGQLAAAEVRRNTKSKTLEDVAPHFTKIIVDYQEELVDFGDNLGNRTFGYFYRRLSVNIWWFLPRTTGFLRGRWTSSRSLWSRPRLQRKATSCKRQRQRLGVGSFLLKFKQITLINIHQQCPATTM
jgi:hypothetical protein